LVLEQERTRVLAWAVVRTLVLAWALVRTLVHMKVRMMVHMKVQQERVASWPSVALYWHSIEDKALDPCRIWHRHGRSVVRNGCIRTRRAGSGDRSTFPVVAPSWGHLGLLVLLRGQRELVSSLVLRAQLVSCRSWSRKRRRLCCCIRMLGIA